MADALTKRARTRQARDKGLVEAARSGDDTAFGKLYDEWVDNVYDRAVRAGASAARPGRSPAHVPLRLQRPGQAQAAGRSGEVLQVARRETTSRSGDHRPAPAPPCPVPPRMPPRATDANLRPTTTSPSCPASRPPSTKTREVLDLHYRQGLTRNETAAVLGESPERIAEIIAKLPPALAALTRARVLWRGGSPEDPELREQLATDGVKRVNASAVRTINRFAKDNDRARARSLISIPDRDVQRHPHGPAV
jgi:hypothetical protein